MSKTRVILTILLGLLLLGVASADTFPKGYVNGDGYVYNGGGVWSLDGAYYTRSLYQSRSPGYWSYGTYYPGAYKYYYSYAPYAYPAAAPTYSAPSVPAYGDPDWKKKLLDIAAARDKIEGDIRRGAHDHAYYMQAIQALGLQGNFRWEGYGTVPPYASASYGTGAGMPYAGAAPYSYSLANYGATANTQYGYSYNTIAQVYGDTNLNSLYQQAGQLTQNAQRLSGEATTGFQGLVGQEGGNRARVAEILARGQMAHQILQALQSPGETKGYTFKFSTGGKVERIEEPSVEPETKTYNLRSFKDVAGARCASCHSGTKAKGGFDIGTYPTMKNEDKQKVWQILTTDDDKVRMPRGPDGLPGKRLTPEELKAFLVN